MITLFIVAKAPMFEKFDSGNDKFKI